MVGSSPSAKGLPDNLLEFVNNGAIVESRSVGVSLLNYDPSSEAGLGDVTFSDCDLTYSWMVGVRLDRIVFRDCRFPYQRGPWPLVHFFSCVLEGEVRGQIFLRPTDVRAIRSEPLEQVLWKERCDKYILEEEEAAFDISRAVFEHELEVDELPVSRFVRGGVGQYVYDRSHLLASSSEIEHLGLGNRMVKRELTRGKYVNPLFLHEEQLLVIPALKRGFKKVDSEARILVEMGLLRI